MNLSVYPVAAVAFEHDDEVVHDFTVFSDDLPIGEVSVHESDPTYAYYMGADGHMVMLKGLREISPAEVLRLIMEKLK